MTFIIIDRNCPDISINVWHTKQLKCQVLYQFEKNLWFESDTKIYFHNHCKLLTSKEQPKQFWSLWKHHTMHSMGILTSWCIASDFWWISPTISSLIRNVHVLLESRKKIRGQDDSWHSSWFWILMELSINCYLNFNDRDAVFLVEVRSYEGQTHLNFWVA